MFAAQDLKHVKPEFAPKYHALASAVHLSCVPREAATLISRITSRKESKEEIKAAVRDFLSGIARSPRCLVISLRRILLDIRYGGL